MSRANFTVVRDIPFNPQDELIVQSKAWFSGDEDDTPDELPTFTDDGEPDETFENGVERKVIKPRGRRPARPTPGVETK